MDPRIRSALALYFFGVFGVFLVVTPWTAVWDQAIVALLPTALGAWAQSGWVRGLASGLGALDLVVALQAATELWERMRNPDADESP